MRSIVRPILGAALLLTGASAAMAQTAGAPVAYATQAAPSNAPAPAYAAPSNAPAPTAYAAPSNVPAPGQYQKPPPVAVSVEDREDNYGGHSKESLSGTRAFWDSRTNQY